MSSIAPRINSFSPATSSESNTQETLPEANPPQTPNPAHAGGMPPGQRSGTSEARARRLVVVSNQLVDPEKPAAGGREVTEKASTASRDRDDGAASSSQATSLEEREQSASNSGGAGSFDKPTLESGRAVYEENRLYHGTGDKVKREVLEHGFRRSHRVDGGSAAARSALGAEFQGQNEPPSYNYFTTEKRQAQRYAFSSKSGSPSIVRAIGMRDDLPLEHIMGVDRTSSDIPAQYIVGSKSSAPGPESAVFQKALKRANINVSLEGAGQLLREVQSDSESDFSDSDRG